MNPGKCEALQVVNETGFVLQELVLYLDTHPSGDLVSRMVGDVDTFADGLLMGFTQLFTGVVTILGTLGFMVSINFKISLVVVILTPLSLFVARFIAKRTHSMFTMQAKTRGEQTAYIEEMTGNKKIVDAFSRNEKTLEEFDEINERYQKYSQFFLHLQNFFQSIKICFLQQNIYKFSLIVIFPYFLYIFLQKFANFCK